MSQQPPTHAVSLAPFDENYGDIILRSSDGVDFHVYKGILLVASPFFCDMFSLPDTPSTNVYEGGKPVVDMQESSSTLRCLLRFCYPVDNPKITDGQTFQDVTTAAQKFEMTSAYGAIVDSYLANSTVSPLSQYGLAHRFKFPQLARASAKRCLDFSWSELLDQASKADLTHLSSTDYNRLFQYYQRCSNRCQELVDGNDFTWFEDSEEYAYVSCPCNVTGEPEVSVELKIGDECIDLDVPRKKWWFDHVERIRTSIAMKGPNAVQDIDYHQAAIDVFASGYRTCQKSSLKELPMLSKSLQKQVQRKKDRIKLELDF